MRDSVGDLEPAANALVTNGRQYRWMVDVALWLAATCIAHGLTLITTIEREFARVPGLRFETWRDD